MDPALFVYVMLHAGDDTRLVRGAGGCGAGTGWDVNYGHQATRHLGCDHETLSTLSPDQELTRQ